MFKTKNSVKRMTICKYFKFFSIILSNIILLLFCINVAMASVLVEPGRFILSCKPGGKTTGTIKVTNQSKKEANVQAVIYDWTLDKNDKIVTAGLGKRSDSLNGMIKFNPQRFKLAPGASQIVRFTIVADKSPGEKRGIIFFEEKDGTMKATGAEVVTQVGCTLYLGITPLKMAFRQLDAKVETSKNSFPSGILELKNEGMGHIRYVINYRLIDQKGAVTLEGKTEEYVVLPGFQRKVKFPIKGKINAGKYRLQLTVEFQGTTKKLEYSLPFTQVKSI